MPRVSRSRIAGSAGRGSRVGTAREHHTPRGGSKSTGLRPARPVRAQGMVKHELWERVPNRTASCVWVRLPQVALILHTSMADPLPNPVLTDTIETSSIGDE